MTENIIFQDKPTAVAQSMTTKDKHLIDENNFQKLIQVQEDIYNMTEVRPSLRKLVNLIIDEVDIDAIKNQLIKQYQ